MTPIPMPSATPANEWFKNTLLSRLDDKRTGAIVIVMQRVHMDDLTGFVTGQSDEWEILNLSAIAEADEDIPISARKSIGVASARRFRRCASRFPFSKDLKAQLGSDAFSAQYQQMPVPPGGAMIKRDWIKRYVELPLQRERSLILQSWDTASKGGPENDFSVCTTWFMSRDRPMVSDRRLAETGRLSRAQGRRAHSCLPIRCKPRARRRRRHRDFARSRVARARSMVFSRSNRIATRSPGCPSSPQSSSLVWFFFPSARHGSRISRRSSSRSQEAGTTISAIP